jgi:hypothetical protein
MTQLIFDICTILGGVLFSLFSVFIFTIHKKYALYSLYVSIVFFIGAIICSVIKNSEDSSSINYSQSKAQPFVNDTLIKILSHIALNEKELQLTEKRLSIIEKHMEPTGKPFLTITGINLDTVLPGRYVVVRFNIENKGNALADKISFWGKVDLHSTSSYDGEFQREVFSRMPPVNPNTIHVGTLASVDKLSNTTYFNLSTQKRFLYFYGIVLYCDNRGIKDSTAFCIVYDGKTKNNFTYNSSYNF